MSDVLLKTDLSSLRVSRSKSGDVAHYVDAAYWRGCPIPQDPSSQPLIGGDLSTYLLSLPAIRPWEPGVYYRLPQVAWEAAGSSEPLSLIPLDIAIEHSPYDDADERVCTSHLSYGAHTVCGLFPNDVAAKWAALSPKEWFIKQLTGIWRSRGPFLSCMDALAPGIVHLSYDEPLLPRAVEVFRETV